MSYTERFTEDHYPLAVYNADSLGVGTFNSPYVTLQEYHRAILVVNLGDMGQAATFDAGIQQATTVAGGGVKAIAGKAITQLTQAGGDGDQLVAIELQTEELDVDGRFAFVRFYLTVGGSACEVSAILYGIISRHKAVPVTNWAEVIG